MNRFIIRDYINSDKDFIYESWNRGLRHSNKDYELIESKVYNDQFQSLFNKLLESNDITIKVACLPDVEDVILGYTIYQGTTIHWVFVKVSFRKMGIARALVPEDIKTCTNLSPPGKYLAKKYGIQFKPFN